MTNYSIAVSLRQPGTFGAGWVPTYSIYRERRSEFQAYVRTTEIGGEASATKEVSTNGSVRLAYNLEYGRTQAQPALLCAVFNRCTQLERDQISLVATPLAIASAQYSLARIDNPFNPSRGFEFRTEFRSSQRELGSAPDLTFNKGTIDAAWFIPVNRGSVFAVRVNGGLVLGPNSSVAGSPQYIPPTERLYAGGANSVRGFQQNELGALLYIAQGYDSVVVTDSTRYFRSRNDTIPFRVVPTGGNALFVTNLEYRVADIFFPGTLQYTFFVDGGDVWTRGVPGTGLGWSKMAWTPGVGIRINTPVGPLQVNVAYNPYPQPTGAIYYDAPADPVTHVAPLFCVSPNNTIPVHISSTGYNQDDVPCPATFTPSQSATFFRRLTFTFSVGPQF
jgi:outer membrane protein assembly factor BamA